ncbi:type II secretion system protein [Pseudomonas sp. dw_358]|uniref:type II secretion system protein n=1 Tax=Pseudomonas sp. dw_358 TaxID=2720083 RepID=UPI001BD61C89|nr:type II secretion system protein [Pseudomonas sp. dw_358]
MKRCIAGKRRESGFTLLELLAAVSLLAIGFFVVFSAMGSATRSLLKDDEATHLALTARSIFDGHARGAVQVGQWQGDEDRVHWNLASTVMRSTAAVKLFKLELTLTDGYREEHFTTLRAQSSDVRLTP